MTRYPFSIEPEDWQRTDIPPFPGVEDERNGWAFLIRDFGVQILLRPGFCSQVGFLGRGEQLNEVIATDDATLRQLGVTHEQVADELERLVLDAQHQLAAELVEVLAGRRERPSGRYPVGDYDVAVHLTALGMQHCPWAVVGDCPNPHVASGSEWTIEDRTTGTRLSGPMLSLHLIRAHHFFEGRGVPYRVEPADLVALLKLGSSNANRIA
jgi:hypothetical protein